MNKVELAGVTSTSARIHRMGRLLSVTVSVAVLLAACGIGRPMPRHSNAAPGVEARHVLLFGDSILVSAAPEITQALADKGMTATVSGDAHNGATPVQGTWSGTDRTPLEQLRFLLDTVDPDIVVGNFTGNGFSDPNTWDRAITDMTAAVRDSGAVMYWTIPPYIGGRHLDAAQWAGAVTYFEALPGHDPLAAGHMIDWRSALRPQNDQIWVGGAGPIRSRFASSLTGDGGGTVRQADEVHTTDVGDRRLAAWTTWALRGEWGIA